MRIHRLRIQAFGPFADEVEVDLDALSEAGLFLLTGATGSGKTSVLDAVCFALYGAVPGDRQIAKRLRCDQAGPGVAPEVTMEFTVQGRRFRVDRSPAWERPKKRGSGMTLQQASVLVCERTDGQWRSLATRLDDAGHLITGLLGMSLAQFCQVQLLPQGRFGAFLRAGSDERHQLLQHLFRTARFEDVEAWLRERRRRLHRASQRHHDVVADLVSRLSETAAQAPPESWDLHALAAVAEEIPGWAEDLLAVVDRAAGEAEREVAVAASAEVQTRADLDAARALLTRREEWQAASREHEDLLGTAELQADRQRRLEVGRRVAALVPLASAAQQQAAEAELADEEAQQAEAFAREALADLGVSVEDDATPCLASHEREAADIAAAARAMQPRVHEREALVTQLAADQQAHDTLRAQLAEIREQRTDQPAALAGLREDEDAAQRAADSVPAARREVELVRTRRDAARSVARLVAELTQARARHTESVDRLQSLREEWLDLQERRLAGMAAEIADGLAVGASCPVCGSADHPHRARPLPGSPDAAAVRRARRAVDDAEAERHARQQALSDLETQIAAARARADHLSVPVLDRELADRSARLARLVDRAAELEATTTARHQLEGAIADLAQQEAALATEESALQSAVTQRSLRITALGEEIDALLARFGHDDTATLVQAATRATEACAAARAATSTHDSLQRQARATRTRAEAAAAEQSFATLEEALDAALSEQALAALERDLDAHRARLAAVTARLDDPDLVAAQRAESPDVAALHSDHTAADERLATVRANATDLRRRATRLARLREDLDAALTAWEPVRSDHEVTDRLASLADGTSADNRWRMRLSGYVLGFRLRQVVASANERLGTMTDGRYHLEHAGDRGAGEKRGGLSLRIRDDWSGELRDPATLSGGETFVVSLALALGLADVIAHEAGGTELDTLFVDEGFGTLDAETLDDVMGVLDSLREGGRVVGVVSHVAELRDRIPAQLQVTKHRTGSTLAQ